MMFSCFAKVKSLSQSVLYIEKNSFLKYNIFVGSLHLGKYSASKLERIKMDLNKYIGETTTYDKKLKLEKRKPKSWLKSVSAFANTNGGYLIFGLEEDNTVVGLEDYQKDSEIISENIKEKIDPLLEFDLSIENIDGNNIIILSIESGKKTPYYVVDNGNRTAYIRLGNQSVPASSDELYRLTLKRSNLSFDELDTDIDVKNASFSKLRAMYYMITKKEFKDTYLESFSLVRNNGKLTNAGALLADERFIYQSRIFCTRWNGFDKANGKMEAIDDSEFDGGILYLLQSANDFVSKNSKKMWKKAAKNRIEYPDYPELAVREAIVNAIIHRDYTVKGSEVHIDMYDDRLEVSSPGGMVDGSFIQERDINNIISKRRNNIIADVFDRLDLMERRGSGLKKILDYYKVYENYSEDKKVVFESNPYDFRVVLPNLNFKIKNVTDNVVENVTDIPNRKLSKTERLEEILKILSKNPETTMAELSVKLFVTQRTINRDIKKLQEDGRVERVGSDSKGYWKILE